MNVNGRPTYLKETPIYLPVLGKSNPSAAGSDLIDLDEAPAHVSVLKAVQRLAGSRITPPDPNSTKQPKLLRDLSAVSSVGRTPCLEANMRRVVRLSSQAVPGCSQNVGRYSLFDANNMVVLGSERAKTVANHKPTNMHLVEQVEQLYHQLSLFIGFLKSEFKNPLSNEEYVENWTWSLFLFVLIRPTVTKLRRFWTIWRPGRRWRPRCSR
uniref:Uncharacterized protein n=2 Tax=Spongospora subterranea TaxID=70186 RepID=A0A0H5QW78_9EUKA|eukprot:CRZ06007.1 hypothetical protein [Spongospora subterranea]